MSRGICYARLSTERRNRASRELDRLPSLAIASLMNREDQRAVTAVGRVRRAVAVAVDLIVESLRSGGRLVFVGAGTSGRLGVLEAAECPPTFGTPPGMVRAIMAGGPSAVFRSREGAEDDVRAAARAVRRQVRPGDVVVGISASGVTPFVRAALAEARRLRAQTLLVACDPSALAERGRIRHVIALAPGPEVLAGSTRLKAGTATKLVLNTLTTASMARLGRVLGNRMVGVVPRSAKLRARAVTLVADLARVTPARARRALAASRGHVRLAVVMAATGLGRAPAEAVLRAAGGSLRHVLARGGGAVANASGRGLASPGRSSGPARGPGPSRTRRRSTAQARRARREG